MHRDPFFWLIVAFALLAVVIMALAMLQRLAP
jgi:hypothetical protein